MQSLAQFAPALLMLFLQVAVYIAQNRGWLTPDQGMALMATMAPLGVHVAYKTAPPAAKASVVDAVTKAGPIAMVGLLLLATGCAARFEESRGSVKFGASPDSARCISLDGQHRTWGGVGKTSAFLAGAAGIATIPATDARVEMGLAIGAATAGAVAAGAVFVSESAAASYVAECR